jgi:hypothetical protein
MPMQQQLMLIQASQAHPGEKAVFLQQANDLLGSIAELAIEDSVMGLHWKKLHDAADLDACTEETIAMLLQAFNQNSNSSATVSGILKWLYTARKDHYWSNTRATAAVVDGILQSGKMLLEPTAALRLETEEQTVKVNNHLLNGNSFAFQAMDKKPSAVWVFNTTNQPTKGGVSFYYFTSHPPKELQSSGVQLTKQLYRWDDQNGKGKLITENDSLLPGDKVLTELTITTNRKLSYVQLHDQRAATLEPNDQLSKYEYYTGVSAYHAIDDAAHNFFVSAIEPGTSVIYYVSKVSFSGVFAGGIASLACMYQPLIKVYASAGALQCK